MSQQANVYFCRTISEADRKGDRRAVGIHMQVIRINWVNVESGTFNADISVLILYRKDMIDVSKEGIETLDVVFPDAQLREWKPKRVLSRSIDKNGVERDYWVVKSINNHEYIFQQIKYEIIGSIETCSQLSNYPFDCHEICISKFLSGTNASRLAKGVDSCYFCEVDSLDDEQRHTQWLSTFQREAVIVRSEATEPIRSFWSVTKPIFLIKRSRDSKDDAQISFSIVRKSSPILYNGFFITFIVMLMVFTAFGLEYDDVGGRLAIVGTSVLSLIALKFSLSSSIPVCAMPNYYDIYVNVSIIACFVIMLLIAALARGDPEHQDTEADDLVFTIALSVFTLFQFVYFIIVFLNMYPLVLMDYIEETPVSYLHAHNKSNEDKVSQAYTSVSTNYNGVLTKQYSSPSSSTSNSSLRSRQTGASTTMYRAYDESHPLINGVHHSKSEQQSERF